MVLGFVKFVDGFGAECWFHHNLYAIGGLTSWWMSKM